MTINNSASTENFRPYYCYYFISVCALWANLECMINLMNELGGGRGLAHEYLGAGLSRTHPSVELVSLAAALASSQPASQSASKR